MNEALKKLSEEAAAKLAALFSSEDFKALAETIKAAADTGTFRMVVSSEHTDRQGEVVMQDGIDVSNYMKNPVVLNSHDYWGINSIVGMTQTLTKEVIDGVKCTVATGKFAPTETGQLARKLYEGGFLNAGSIGFIAKTFSAESEAVITTSEMLEWSFCSVPANAAALRLNALGVTVDMLRSKGFAIQEKGAIPYADHGTAPEGTAWDAAKEVAAAGDDVKKLKEMCAWYDDANPDLKGSYKLPHHQADGLKAVWDGVAAAMGALLGARGGVNIPDADRKGVYNHLKKHYDEFGKTAPDFKEKAVGDTCTLDDSGTPGILIDDPENPGSYLCVPNDKTRAAGDPCQMNDGSDGVMGIDESGQMVCMPPSAAGKSLVTIAYKMKGQKDAQQVGAILMQMQNIIDNAIIMAAKLILDIIQSAYGQTQAGKAEIAKIFENSNSILLAIKTEVGDLEKKLGIPAGEERQNGAPEQRPSDPGSVAVIKDINDFLLTRDFLKSISKVANEGLAHMNERMRKDREARTY